MQESQASWAKISSEEVLSVLIQTPTFWCRSTEWSCGHPFGCKTHAGCSEQHNLPPPRGGPCYLHHSSKWRNEAAARLSHGYSPSLDHTSLSFCLVRLPWQGHAFICVLNKLKLTSSSCLAKEAAVGEWCQMTALGWQGLGCHMKFGMSLEWHLEVEALCQIIC